MNPWEKNNWYDFDSGDKPSSSSADNRSDDQKRGSDVSDNDKRNQNVLAELLSRYDNLSSIQKSAPTVQALIGLASKWRVNPWEVGREVREMFDKLLYHQSHQIQAAATIILLYIDYTNSDNRKTHQTGELNNGKIYQIYAKNFQEGIAFAKAYLKGGVAKTLIIDIHGSYLGPSLENEHISLKWTSNLTFFNPGSDLTLDYGPNVAHSHAEFEQIDFDLSKEARNRFPLLFKQIGGLVDAKSTVIWASCAVGITDINKEVRDNHFALIYEWMAYDGEMYYSNSENLEVTRRTRTDSKKINHYWLIDIKGQKWVMLKTGTEPKIINVKEGYQLQANTQTYEFK